MKISVRHIAMGIALCSSILIAITSCHKDPFNSPIASKKLSTQVDPWTELRARVQSEYDDRFGAYYHTRDFLQHVNWDHAFVNDIDGRKVMVFSYVPDDKNPVIARLMVVEDENGTLNYAVRVKSSMDSQYESLYTPSDKMIYVGTSNGNTFTPLAQTQLMSEIKSFGIAACDECHSRSGDDQTPSDPVPGGGSLWGDNWLGDVQIIATVDLNGIFPADWWYSEPNYIWQNNNGSTPPVSTIDPDPCKTFNNLMNDPNFRGVLQQLIANTTLNYETAFTYNGTTFSPFVNGTAGGSNVNFFVSGDAIVAGHSHYGNAAYGTFSPQDLLMLYNASNGIQDPMGFALVIATPFGGVSMVKIVNRTLFNAFAQTYLIGNSWINILEPLYDTYAHVGTGADAATRLQILLDQLDSGLKVVPIPNPSQDATHNPCQ